MRASLSGIHGSRLIRSKKRLGDELQIRSFEVVPYVNYGQWFAPTAYRNNLKGVIISPVPFFWNISKG